MWGVALTKHDPFPKKKVRKRRPMLLRPVGKRESINRSAVTMASAE